MKPIQVTHSGGTSVYLSGWRRPLQVQDSWTYLLDEFERLGK